MKKCQNCGQENDDFNQVCEVCHTPLTDNVPNYSQNGNNPSNYNPNNYNQYANQNQNSNNGYNTNNSYNPNNGYNPNNQYNTNGYNGGNYPKDNNGTYSLVFGILSIFCCAIIFGPLAIVKGSQSHDSMGKVGKILGIIGLVLFVLGIILNIAGVFNVSSWSNLSSVK